MINTKIRDYAKSKRVWLWEIADVLRISEPTMTRKLRAELSEDETNKMMSIIDSLASRKEVK